MKSPVVIIGAGRSGTNALRDALCSLDGLSTWPCDEINYIWRHGNRDHPTDELLPPHASPQAREKILGAFDKMQRRSGSDRIVEKTCANSLRVAFVDEVLPEPTFIHIVRDGRDATSSAMSRWTAQLDLPYLLKKARFVPAVDLPHYALNYLRTRIARTRSDDKRLGWWGPKFEGMEQLRSGEHSLASVAAHQWAACVGRALDQLVVIPDDRKLIVRYESLVVGPAIELRRVVDHLGLEVADADVELAASTIRGGSVGTYEDRLTAEEITTIESVAGEVMLRLDK